MQTPLRFVLTAALACLLVTEASAQPKLSDAQASQLFRGVDFDAAIARRTMRGTPCEQELRGGSWGEKCDLYRAASLEVLTMEDLRLAWCKSRLLRLQADAGGGPDAKIIVPPVCSIQTPADDQGNRIVAMMGALNPARAAQGAAALREQN